MTRNEEYDDGTLSVATENYALEGVVSGIDVSLFVHLFLGSQEKFPVKSYLWSE